MIRNHPALKNIELPPLGGQAGSGGPLVTMTLLIYGLMATSNRATDPGALVAYDKRTGATLGEVQLPSAPIGSPMTYSINGTQYIALTLHGGRVVSLAMKTGG